MRDFKGTQGEWEFKEDKLSNGWTSVTIKDTSHVVCTCYTGLGTPDFEELIANAKLIAAAPELLKELMKIRLDIKLGLIPVSKDSPIYKGIDNAINKAIGNE